MARWPNPRGQGPRRHARRPPRRQKGQADGAGGEGERGRGGKREEREGKGRGQRRGRRGVRTAGHGGPSGGGLAKQEPARGSRGGPCRRRWGARRHPTPRRRRRGPGHPPIRAESRRRLGVGWASGCVGLPTDGVGRVGGPPRGVGLPSATGGRRRRRRRRRRAREARPGRVTSADLGLGCSGVRCAVCGAVPSRPGR